MYNNLKVLIILGLALALSPAGASANPETLTDHYIAMALQGDLNAARTLFDETGVNGSPFSDTGLVSRFHARFVDQSEMLIPDTGDAFADAVVHIYREYWVGT